MRILSILTIIVGISVGLWAWQVNNINMATTKRTVLHDAVNHETDITYYNPVSVEDRAFGMAFAYLLCAVGGFTFVMSTTRLRPGES